MVYWVKDGLVLEEEEVRSHTLILTANFSLRRNNSSGISNERDDGNVNTVRLMTSCGDIPNLILTVPEFWWANFLHKNNLKWCKCKSENHNLHTLLTLHLLSIFFIITIIFSTSFSKMDEKWVRTCFMWLWLSHYDLDYESFLNYTK